MEQSLNIIENARLGGMDVTACVYPYDSWATYLDSARFDEGWQKRFRITYGDLQLGGSGERLNEASFRKYRDQGKLAGAYAIPESDVIAALKRPWVMIASDGILEDGYNNHPRASGTFARTIGRYSREKKVLTLMEALSKMTIQPARRLEKAASAMKRKGRLSAGNDADITVFDYAKIRDAATVEHPEYASEGIVYVIVGGEIVKGPDGLMKKKHPGKPVKSGFGKRTPLTKIRN